MTPEERQRFEELCKKIQAEDDPERFDEYVRELKELLDAKHDRIHPQPKAEAS